MTDLQAFAAPAFRGVSDRQVPKGVPLHGYNLGGYATTVLGAGRPGGHEFGGLSDATFAIGPVERGWSAVLTARSVPGLP